MSAAATALSARRRAMMDEDDPSDLVTQHSPPRRRPPPPPSSSPRVVVTLAGRVYRPPTQDEKDVLTKAEIEANLLLSEPVETVDDLAQSRRLDRRKAVELEMKRQRIADATSSPAKRTGRFLAFDSDDDQDAHHVPSPTKVARTPTKRTPATPPPRPPAATCSSPSPSLGLPFGFPCAASTGTPVSPRRNRLPPSLVHLVALHTALERALILHLSTHGSSVASTVSSVDPTSAAACVRMTNLIDLPTLTRMLAASGKRFTETELAKLCWVWQGCGDAERDVDDGGGDGGLTIRGDEAGGMGFVVTRSRLSKLGKVSSTYGLGISVEVKANPQLPKFELLPPPSSPKRSAAAATTTTMPPSPTSIGKGRDGMSIVALWTQGNEDRRKEVERRLERWARGRGKDAVDAEFLQQGDPDHPDDGRWATSTISHLLRHVPTVDLPPLDFAVPAIASTRTPSPNKAPGSSSPSTPRSTRRTDLPVVSPKDFVKALMDGRPVKTKSGSTLDRDKARRERIEAKQRASQPTAYQASLSGLASGGSSPSKRSLKPQAKDDPDAVVLLTAQEIYKQRAMLSRLGSIADVVAMRCGTRPTRFDDVCTAVSNSPLLSIGFDEADESIAFLARKFPDFCYIKVVGGGGNNGPSASSSSSSPSSLLSRRGGERWIVLTGHQKPKEVKEIVRDELNQTDPKA